MTTEQCYETVENSNLKKETKETDFSQGLPSRPDLNKVGTVLLLAGVAGLSLVTMLESLPAS